MFLWYSLCASFKTKIMVVLTIFILEREKITFFRWFWPHQFSPWPQNDPDLTFNLCSRSNFETCLVSFKSLIFGKCNKGSLVTVSCSVQISWWILLPLPHSFPIFWKSAIFDTHNFRPLYKLNVQAIRLLTSRKWNEGCCSFIWYQETFLPLSARFSKKIRAWLMDYMSYILFRTCLTWNAINYIICFTITIYNCIIFVVSNRTPNRATFIKFAAISAIRSRTSLVLIQFTGPLVGGWLYVHRVVT